jgi:PIF1-like helicase
MFGIDSDSHKSTGTQLAQIKSRLQGVDYVFVDEVSMLSCCDMYKISEWLATINNNPESPFGGLNMIFSGDFAQLPPPIGKEHAALYSRTVGVNAVSLHDQESAIGKALWHQVTTVIILWQNIRQKHESKDDSAFHTALTNMHYKACTPADIAFLKTRISADIKGRPCVTDKGFRNVSIITAHNAKKDETNWLDVVWFSLETNQNLTHSVSIDTVTHEDTGGSGGNQHFKLSRWKQQNHIKIP